MEEIKLEAPKANKHSNKKLVWVIVGCVLAGIILLAIIFSIPASNPVNYENYCKIQNGMSYSQVVDIFEGKEGELSSHTSSGGYSLTIYIWEGNGFSNATVGFENGKVISKFQIGLN